MIDLSYYDLVMVYGLILLSAALIKLRGGAVRSLLISALRMGLQLFAVG